MLLRLFGMTDRFFATVFLIAGFLPVSLAAQTSPSGLDCGKAKGTIDKMVCGDPSLQALDRSVSSLYQTVEKDSRIKAQEKAEQERWSGERDACAQSTDAHACIESTYQRRLISLQIATHALNPPKTAQLTCSGGKPPLTASFYNDTSPQSALLKYGSEQTIVLIERSGSGARYGAPGYEYWEHQGEAAVTWRGKPFTCKVTR
jgi:uncharacterized protein